MGLGIGVATFLAIGLPTAVIPSPIFGRQIPVRPEDYVFLALTSLMAAAIGATYAFPAACSLQEGKLTAGGMLSFFAIGCPVCNKLAVLLLGWGGAMTYFAPLQPLLAIVSLVLFAVALRFRLRAIGLTRRAQPPVLST
jgi:hypothetical protein